MTPVGSPRRAPYVDRYLRASGLVGWHPAQLGACRVDGDMADALRVAVVLEEDTAISAAQARALGLHRSADLGAFLPTWEREEAEHARALRFLLQLVDGAALRPRSIPIRRRAVARLPVTAAGLLPETALVFCALGVAGEHLAISSYATLASRAEDEPVQSLLAAIAHQEGRHFAFFLAAARARAEMLSTTRGRIARAGLVRFWQPIGVASLDGPKWRALYRTWLNDEGFRARVGRMDRALDTIPHLGGLALMERFLHEWDR